MKTKNLKRKAKNYNLKFKIKNRKTAICKFLALGCSSTLLVFSFPFPYGIILIILRESPFIKKIFFSSKRKKALLEFMSFRKSLKLI